MALQYSKWYWKNN